MSLNKEELIAFGKFLQSIYFDGATFEGKADEFIKQHSVEKEWDVLETGWNGMKLEYIPIKVKRLSDNLIFEVGQVTDKGKIEKFEIKENGLFAYTLIEKGSPQYFNLSKLSHLEVFKDELDILRSKFDALKKDFDQLSEKIKK